MVEGAIIELINETHLIGGRVVWIAQAYCDNSKFGLTEDIGVVLTKTAAVTCIVKGLTLSDWWRGSMVLMGTLWRFQSRSLRGDGN
jgi:hypothetical protein